MKNFYSLLKSLTRFSQIKKISFKANHKKPYIIPTGIGFTFAFLILIIVFVGLNNKNNLIFLFSFFLFSIGLVVMRKTHRNLEKIQIHFYRQPTLFKNEKSYLEYTVENPTKNSSYDLKIKPHGTTEIITIHEIKAKEILNVKIPYTPTKTGYQITDNLILESTFPFSFLKVWRITNSHMQTIIYPEKLNFISHSSYGDSPEKDKSEGEKTALTTDREFSHFQKFNTGDPAHNINWKIFARTEKLFTNKYQSLGDIENSKVVDWHSTYALNNLDQQKSQFTFWIHNLFEQKENFLVRYNNQTFQIHKNDQRNYHKILTQLAIENLSPLKKVEKVSV